MIYPKLLLEYGMGKPLGLKKSGGRNKGTLNRRTEAFLDTIGEFDYDPLRNIMQKYESLPPAEQIKIDLKLLEYVYPKLKEQALNIGEPEPIKSYSEIIFKIHDLIENSKTDAALAERLKAITGNQTVQEIVSKYADLSAEFL